LGTKPVYDGYYGRLVDNCDCYFGGHRIRHYGLFANL